MRKVTRGMESIRRLRARKSEVQRAFLKVDGMKFFFGYARMVG